MAVNLLPPIQKQELKDEKLRKKIILFLFLVLLDLLLLMAIIFGLYIYTSKMNSSLTGEISKKEKLLLESRSQEIKKIIKSTNQDIYKINSVKKEQVSVVGALEKLNELVPNTVYLMSFSFKNIASASTSTSTSTSGNVGKIKLNGLAKSREVAFSFYKILTQDPSFKNVEFDTSSWEDPVNANFITNEFSFIPTKK